MPRQGGIPIYILYYIYHNIYYNIYIIIYNNMLCNASRLAYRKSENTKCHVAASPRRRVGVAAWQRVIRIIHPAYRHTINEIGARWHQGAASMATRYRLNGDEAVL